ncbi:MAG: helix-turn-helix domain-containing protein [Candidatus Zixiibacteriota bacterium]
MSDSSEKLWTMADVANYCQVKESVVKYWIYNANLPYIKLGKHIRFQEKDVKGWIIGMNNGTYGRNDLILFK